MQANEEPVWSVYRFRGSPKLSPDRELLARLRAGGPHQVRISLCLMTSPGTFQVGSLIDIRERYVSGACGPVLFQVEVVEISGNRPQYNVTLRRV